MLSGSQFFVFDKYLNARDHAFSSGKVSEEDKEIYQEIFSSLRQAVENSIAGAQFSAWFDTTSVRFGQSGGVQGHRPVDLWAAIVNRAPETFGDFPQIYIIASGSGLELGFSAAIHEKDYYNKAVRERNREIIPILYGKLPDPESNLVKTIDIDLSKDKGWHFDVKSRNEVEHSFSSASELIRFLKSPQASERGGGSIYNIVGRSEIEQPGFDLGRTFSEIVVHFAPLMRTLTASSKDQIRLQEIEFIAEAAEQVPEFDPHDLADGRRKALRNLAIRQGQKKFREGLLDAYDSRCAVTGTYVPAVLEAAHIVPYLGPDTNTVQNGLLLRADVHNLFDLGLIEIEPDTLDLRVSKELQGTLYMNLHGHKLRTPRRSDHRPSSKALSLRQDYFSGRS